MKRGDIVKTQRGLGVIVAYHERYDNRPGGYPWYVWIAGEIHYFQTRELKKVG